MQIRLSWMQVQDFITEKLACGMQGQSENLKHNRPVGSWQSQLENRSRVRTLGEFWNFKPLSCRTGLTFSLPCAVSVLYPPVARLVILKNSSDSDYKWFIYSQLQSADYSNSHFSKTVILTLKTIIVYFLQMVKYIPACICVY